MKVYTVIQDPKMKVVPNFISDEEIQHILGLAEEANAWVPSVVWRGGNRSQRTSSSFWHCRRVVIVAIVVAVVAVVVGRF